VQEKKRRGLQKKITYEASDGEVALAEMKYRYGITGERESRQN